jgi:hypothetical protein
VDIDEATRTIGELRAQAHAQDVNIKRLTAGANTNAETVRAIRAVLDAAGVPAQDKDSPLSTSERVQWLIDRNKAP